jgi:hypothetical protein
MSMKIVLSVIGVICVGTCMCATPKKSPKDIEAYRNSPEYKAKAYEQMLIHTGGPIEVAGMGKIAVINCQKMFSVDKIAEKVDAVQKQLRVKIELIEGKLEMYKVPEGYAASLYIVDDPSLPLTLYAIERGWGVMNVNELQSIDRRFIRLFNRAAVMTFGGAISMNRTSPLQPLADVEALDKMVVNDLPFESVQMISVNLAKRGVTSSRRAMYRKACQEGWAPMPTNKYQKAIWDKFNEKPTKGVEIKFDPKKGE